MNILEIIGESCRKNPMVAASVGFLIFFFSMLTVVPAFVFLLGAGFGIGLEEATSMMERLSTLTEKEIMYMRIQQGGTQVLSWGLAAILVGMLMGSARSYLRLDVKAPPLHYLLAGVIVLVSVPLIQAVTFSESSFNLPEFLGGLEEMTKETEARAEELVFRILGNPRFSILGLNILVMAVAPAFCEEMFFRGFLQRELGKAWNVHAGIWAAAILFSLMHFQLYGFFSRLLLGAMLGYMVHGSKSLWPAIVGHFMFNFFNILLVFMAERYEMVDESLLQNEASIPWMFSLLSLAAVAALFYVYFRFVKQEPESVPVSTNSDSF